MRKAVIVAVALLCVPFSKAVCANTAPVGRSEVVKNNDVIYDDWLDQSRHRTVPVKIYLPSKGVAPYPVVIFSHGLGGSREAAEYLGEYLCSRGYLCVHVQHPGSDSSIWKSAAGQGREAILTKLEPQANGQNALLRIGDIKFVLDELERRDHGSSPLAGKLDLNKIALAGHSFGAGTTLAIAGQNHWIANEKMSAGDPRIKAAIYLSPPCDLRGRTSQQVFGDIRIPGMLMTGTNDYSPIGRAGPKERLLPYEGIGASDQYLVVFEGGDHMIFSGRSQPGNDSSRDEKFHKMINVMSTAFLDAYLCGDQQAKQWLERDAKTFLGTAADYKFK